MRGKQWIVAAFAAVAMTVAAGCGGDESSGEGGTETVKIGTIRGSSADAAVFIAMEKGYFEKQGVKVELQEFNTGAQFVAPLGSGQLDVGSGAISAGLMNAVDGGVGIKMVAAKSQIGTPSYTSLVVAKKHVDSGRYNDLADLKGMKVALPALGIPPHYELSLFLEEAGLTVDDVTIEQIGFAEMVPALSNGSVDAAIAIEPSATLAERSGGAEKVAGTHEVFPGEQSAAIMFGDRFIEERRDVAQRVMNAYLEGVRYYLGALEDAKLTGERGEEIAKILTKYTAVKDAKVYMGIPLHVVPPDIDLNTDYIQREVDFWHEQGLIKSEFDVDDAIDTSFAQKSVEEMGPAKAGAEQ
jgi:NitT/TauT family transport system substrate-binding protein